MRAGKRFWWPSSLPTSTSVPIPAWVTSSRASAIVFFRIGERVALVTTPISGAADMHAIAVADSFVALHLEADQHLLRVLRCSQRPRGR